MSDYRKNKNWNMFVEDNKLFITKGADEIYFLDDIDEEQAEDIYKLYLEESFEQIDKKILNKLEQVGVIFKKITNNESKITLSIRYIGTKMSSFDESIKSKILNSKNIAYTDEEAKSDLLLIIRTNAKLKDVLYNYDEIQVPHLFIDLAYANTISIGPIVYKNETACLGCFIGKITKGWGDPISPEEPEIFKKYELASILIVERVKEFIELGNCPDLVNGVWNFNTIEFNTKLDKVYKLPWCPRCNPSQENPKIILPWEKEGK